MAKRVVIDTSVAVKFFSPEKEDEENILLLLENFKDKAVDFVVPDLILYKLINALKLGKRFSKTSLSKCLSKFVDLRPEVLPLDGALQEGILKLIYKYDLTAYDAVFIALAEQEEIPLVTADYKHHKKNISKKILWLKECDGSP